MLFGHFPVILAENRYARQRAMRFAIGGIEGQRFLRRRSRQSRHVLSRFYANSPLRVVEQGKSTIRGGAWFGSMAKACSKNSLAFARPSGVKSLR
jgi:hypothetical protein